MNDSSTSQDLLSQTLGRYRVLRRIGKGGMGDVWLCEDSTLHRQVAVKTLPSHNQSDREYVLRFEREAQAAATLNHPHILPIHDYGQHQMPNGEIITYIVMPYISGGSLGDQISTYKRQKSLMPPLAALQYLQQAAEAIDYAHQRGLIHRDIKPGNMLLRADNWLLLADFGIARVLSGVERLTETGVGFGTPHYMAPEQAQGKAEFSSDNYSLAIIAYQLFTDRFPFDANTSYAITIQHMTMPVPPPQDFNAAITPMFAAALVQGLAKQPDQRPPSARAFVDGLQRAWQSAPSGPTYETLMSSPVSDPMNSLSPVITPHTQVDTLVPDSGVPIGMKGPTDTNTSEQGHKSSLTRRQLLIGGGVALVAIGGGVGTWEYFHSPTSPVEQRTIANSSTPIAVVAKDQPLVLLGHNKPVASLAWSPTGMLASAGSDGDGQVMLWDVATLYKQASSTPQPKVKQQFGTGISMLLAWSPKGDMLAIANAGIVNGDINSVLLAIYNGDLGSYASGYSDTFAVKNSVSIDGLIWAPSDNFFTLTSPAFNLSAKSSLTAWDVKHPQQKIAAFDLPYMANLIDGQSPLAIAAHTTLLRLAYGIDAGIDIENINLTAQPPTIKKAISKPLDYGDPINYATGTVAWSSDGQVLAGIPDRFNQSTSITTWDFQHNTTIAQSLPNNANTYLLAGTWNPTAGSTLLAGGGNNGTVYIWDTSKDLLPVDQKKPPASIKNSVNALAWSADGQWLAAAYNDTNASIVIWKM